MLVMIVPRDNADNVLLTACRMSMSPSRHRRTHLSGRNMLLAWLPLCRLKDVKGLGWLDGIKTVLCRSLTVVSKLYGVM